MTRGRYRHGLASAVRSTAGPYGYTLTVWTSGSVLIAARGLPSTVDALLFMAGAVAGFGIVAAVAHGGLRAPAPTESMPFALWHGLHFVTIGIAIAVSSLNAHLVENWGAWPIGGFAATAVYLLGVGFQLALGRA